MNGRPTPLALYVFSEKRKDFEYGKSPEVALNVSRSLMSPSLSDTVIERTLSGGACWNDVSIQTVQRGLPFGGVGESGCQFKLRGIRGLVADRSCG